MSLEQTTQVVVDVTALEESIQNFLALETRFKFVLNEFFVLHFESYHMITDSVFLSRTVVNSFRAKLVSSLDQS